MVTIEQQSYSHSTIKSDNRDDLIKIFNYFSYYVEGYRWQPLYKSGRWDGKIKLYNMIDKTIPNGLIPQVREFLDKNDIEYREIVFEDEELTIDIDTLDEFIKELNLPFPVRDYQKTLVLESINRRQMIGVSSTSSGKSLAIYIIIMYMLKHNKRSFLIVPSVSLVHQMRSDFISYGMTEDECDDLVHCIHSGKEKKFTKPIIITTWQSIYKKDILSKYTSDLNGTESQYDCVILDEAHKVKGGDGKKVSDIVEAFCYSPWKIGVTGSLPKHQLTKQQVISALGEPVNIIKAQELVDMGYATDLNLTAIFLEYNEQDKKYVRSKEVKSNWNKEVDFINEHKSKLNFVIKLALSKLEKHENTILFFKRIKFGKKLLEELEKHTEHVYYVDGSVDGSVREEIRKDIENKSGVILVASFGTFSTGINIKKLHNGVFAENPGKSDVTLIQSLGRFLRQHEEKQVSNIYDIIDDFRDKKFENFCYKHFKYRLETYRDEGWFIDEKKYRFK